MKKPAIYLSNPKPLERIIVLESTVLVIVGIIAVIALNHPTLAKGVGILTLGTVVISMLTWGFYRWRRKKEIEYVDEVVDEKVAE